MKISPATFMTWARSRPTPGKITAFGAVVLLAYITLRLTVSTSAVSPFGVLTGTLAALSMVAVMAYSWRRSRPQVRKLGPSKKYLELHIWGGWLFMLLLLVHTDFALPRSPMGWALWLFGAWVVVTGAIGTMLQHTLPKFLVSTSTFEVNLTRAPELVAQLRERAESLVASADSRVKAFYERYVRDELTHLRPMVPFISRRSMRATEADAAAGLLVKTLDASGIAALDALREIRTGKQEIDAHTGVQRVMRAWLVLHLPVAVALLIVVALHILAVAYY
jgi:hypothetical protein